MKRHFRNLLTLFCLITPFASQAETEAAPKQWIYVLRLIPRLHADSAWTKDDEAAVGRHFKHLQEATKTRQVILAGRTLEDGAKAFGLVIFEATDEKAAQAFMESDPAVAGGIMTAELHPYAVALSR